MPLTPPFATPYAPQSQELAQVLAGMNVQPPRTAIAAGADAVAAALNRINDPSNPPQWKDANGAPTTQWSQSPLGRALGGLFGLGQAAAAPAAPGE